MTTLQKARIHKLATAGALKILEQAGAPLDPQEFQSAATEVYKVMVAILHTFITLEASAPRSIEPSPN